jgi:Putative amidoligase enzyme
MKFNDVSTSENTTEGALADMRDYFSRTDAPPKKQVPFKTDKPGIPPDVAMILHRVNKGQTIRKDEYNKLLQYKLELDMKKESAINEQQLDEINMSPTSLRQLAAKINAKAGMEFEMIVPNVSDPDGGDMEADYDSDERVSSISQAIDFFEGGDGVNGRRDLDRLRDQMYEAFYEWSSSAIDELWSRDGESWCRDWIENNEWDEEEKIREHLEAMGLDEGQIEDALEAGRRAPQFTKSSEQQAAREADENYNNYMEAVELADEELDEMAASMAQDYGSDAYDAFREDNQDTLDESDWLSDEGMRWMSDVESNYDITWPYYRSTSDGEADIASVADEFERAVGRSVNWSSSYHGGRRDGTSYVVEPDGSLDADDSSDSGLEFVSPPLPIAELISDLDKVAKWAGRYGCYTNNSTGLHINVSIGDGDFSKLDYVKLALLLGDEHVLETFGRQGNTYCKSAMKIVRDRITERPEDAQAMLQKMKSKLDDLATKVIHSGVTHKYTSINTKEGYVEFRSPGGDWLGEYAEDPGKITNTLLRFVVALDAAMDPEKYRQEYLKKLYTILQPKTHNDTLAYFAQFAAGAMPKAALKSFIKQAQLERKMQKGDEAGEKYWWEVSRPGYAGSIEVVAASKEEAITIATSPDNYPSWKGAQNIVAKPLRPFTGAARPTASSNQSTGSGEFTGWWIIKTPEGQEIHRFNGIGNNQGDANRFAMRWLQQNPENIQVGVEVVPELR